MVVPEDTEQVVCLLLMVIGVLQPRGLFCKLVGGYNNETERTTGR